MVFDTSQVVAKRCAVCRAEPPAGRAHVIPQSLGGRFWAILECPACNGAIGTRIEKDARRALEVVRAAMGLDEETPGLPAVRDVLEGIPWRTPGGGAPVIEGRLRGGTFEPREHPVDASTTLHDMRTGRRRVEEFVRKAVAPEDAEAAVEAALARFDAGEEQVAPGLIISHYSASVVEATWLDKRLLDRRVPLHTAYLFLAFLLVGTGRENVLDGPGLAATRELLSDAQAGQPSYELVMPVDAGGHEAAHTVTQRPRTNELSIVVQFFGSAGWEVHLPPVELSVTCSGEMRYLHDLTTHQQVLQRRTGEVYELAPSVAA